MEDFKKLRSVVKINKKSCDNLTIIIMVVLPAFITKTSLKKFGSSLLQNNDRKKFLSGSLVNASKCSLKT